MAREERPDSGRTRLIESNARLELLNDIARGITAGMSVKELVGRALERIHSQFSDLRIAYATVDGEGIMTVMHSMEPAEMPAPDPRRLAFRAPAAYLSAFKEGEVLVVDDVEGDRRLSELSDVMKACGTHAMLGAPVHQTGQLIGVLCFDARASRSWRQHEIATVRDVAGYLAVAIHHARLEEERRKAECSVRESEKRLQRILNSIADVVWVLRADTKQHLYLNPAAEAVSGRSAKEFIEDSDLWPRIIHPEDRERVMSEFARLTREGGTFDVEYRILHADGGVRWVHDRAIAERNEAGKITLVDGTARDITERKRLETQLQESDKMESVGRLAGGLAHDFNNLLTAISGYEALAAESLPDGSPARLHLDEIGKAAGRASDLMRKLLGFARRQRISLEVVCLNWTIRELDSMLKGFLGEDREIVLALDESLEKVRVDPTQIEQVLVNLTVNARDAMPSGGRVTIETSNVTIGAGDAADLLPGRYVLVSVSDTGTGISERDLPHIFEPFFTTKEVGKGTGLGLATSYGIVKQHGGHIEVRSQLGFGSSFRIFLPMAEEAAERPAAGIRIEPAPRGRETILLAEDEPQVRDLIHRVLDRLGYTVLEASDGVEGLDLALKHEGEIDLLLTDVVMPRLGGVELADRLRKRDPRIGVLYISGHAEDAQAPPGMPGPLPLLAKPFFPDELAGQVRAVLDARPASSSRAPAPGGPPGAS